MLTPLDAWICSKIAPSVTGAPNEPLTRSRLEDYQLGRLRATVEHARSHSPFYQRQLAGIVDTGLRSLEDISALPFTTPADILAHDLRFLCVSQGEIERVVTLCSSGTTNAAKRLHFTRQELELTVDFFHHGMTTLVAPGERVLILMPGELPGSVGDLLLQGLERLGAQGILHGIVRDESAAIHQIIVEEIDCLVGLPVQLLGLVRHADAATIPPGRIKSVLLSADHVPAAIVREIERAWGCPVFNHYGMTEMGLGGAVDCRARNGGHLREADLYVEIIDPVSGRPLPDGEPGEVVFTTLTRVGMPLIRYRSGDLSRFIPQPCPCGTVLKRLARVTGRLAGRLQLASGGRLGMAELDEALFPLPGLLNFRAAVTVEHNRDCLQVSLLSRAGASAGLCRAVRAALEGIPVLRQAVAGDYLRIAPPVVMTDSNWQSSSSIKRTLHDYREKKKC